MILQNVIFSACSLKIFELGFYISSLLSRVRTPNLHQVTDCNVTGFHLCHVTQIPQPCFHDIHSIISKLCLIFFHLDYGQLRGGQTEHLCQLILYNSNNDGAGIV